MHGRRERGARLSRALNVAEPAVCAGSSDVRRTGERRVFYKGKVLEAHQHRSEVDFKVRKRAQLGPDRNYWVLFEALFIHECNDGTRELGGGFIKLRFDTKRRFRGSTVEIDDNSDYSKFRVQGLLYDNLRARGWLASTLDRKDPPDSGYPDLPDYSTDGRLKWRADRIPPSETDFSGG